MGSLSKLVLALGASFAMSAQSIVLDVSFKLTDVDNKPLAGVPVRLVFSGAPDWQSPTAGNKIVTGAKGEAAFTTNASLDKKWQMEPIGFTGISKPIRTDHLMVAAELERQFPLGPNGELQTFQWVHTMDIYCKGSGDCATQGILAIYAKDAQGRFTRAAEQVGRPPAWKFPELGGMLLTGEGYNPGNFLLERGNADAQHQRWLLKLGFVKQPTPVRR
jgi:hypothetical protein